MRRQNVMAVLALMGILLISGNALALLPDFTKDELISSSEQIVLGTVQETHSAWTDDHSQIFTYVTLQLTDQFKGDNLGSTIPENQLLRRSRPKCKHCGLTTKNSLCRQNL